MKKIPIVVAVITIYLIFFQTMPFISVPDEVIPAMFLISPFLVIYMVLVVLKNGKPPKYSFEERFYEDLDYERNGREEIMK